MFEVLFQTSQKRGREYAADTAAVERQDALCAGSTRGTSACSVGFDSARITGRSTRDFVAAIESINLIEESLD
jgi:hypothetical protein